MSGNHSRLKQSAHAAIANGRRLLDDVEWLDYEEHRTSAYYLALIAQEEFAKAFLLGLVIKGVIPWDRRLLRAARDHACKQLLCLVMDYLSPDFEQFKKRCDAFLKRQEFLPMPQKVADAISILCYEKIGRWSGRSWVWAEDPGYDPEALAISEGKADKLKQDALYVRLAVDGGVAAIPTVVSRPTLREESERAARMAALGEGLLDESQGPVRDDDVTQVFRAVFASIAAGDL